MKFVALFMLTLGIHAFGSDTPNIFWVFKHDKCYSIGFGGGFINCLKGDSLFSLLAGAKKYMGKEERLFFVSCKPNFDKNDKEIVRIAKANKLKIVIFKIRNFNTQDSLKYSILGPEFQVYDSIPISLLKWDFYRPLLSTKEMAEAAREGLKLSSETVNCEEM